MENFVKLQVPVTISYPALESVLKKQLVGEYIPKPSDDTEATAYAQILDVGLAGSSAGTGEIILRVRIRILRTLLKRDNVDLYVQAMPGYDNTTQQVYIRRFNMQAQTSSRFYNSSLEVLINKVAYNQIIQKARVNLTDIIGAELIKANGMLATGVEVKGLKLTGEVEEVRVQDITPKPNRMFLNLEVQAKVEVDVVDLSELLPA
ncbi:DUF4403 family protein [Pontibacter ramchanderi]|uniref:Uncharacterized protein DUF4403 n=1 Tax=Pontibacter ramchanderi TaxID=1179743 RepID=A0A2N3U8G7_9BACT|nr:DUF4403 family protein [Pontibacter ramchanderi]PKV63043.1 uncharacterized protein DUF4403 [Pontibacter ramchanderi]